MKATKRILALFLTVLMITSSVAMIFAYAETKAPVAGNDVESTPEATPDATPDAAAPNDDKNAGSAPGAMMSPAPSATTTDTGTKINFLTDFTPDNALIGNSLNTLADADSNTEGRQLSSDAYSANALTITAGMRTGTGTAIGGWFEDFELENNTYTVELSMMRTDRKRMNLYYFRGNSYASTAKATYSNNSYYKPSGFGAMVGLVFSDATNNSSNWGKKVSYISDFSAAGTAYGYTNVAVDNTAPINLRYVIKAGAKANGKIPVQVMVYQKDTSGAYKLIASDIGVSTCDYLYLATGGWDAFNANTDSMKISDVTVYEGDKVGVFSNDFAATYEAAKDGDTLFAFTGSTLGGEYEYVNYGNTTYANGTFTIDRGTAAAGKHGFSAVLPFGTGWNNGVYTLEMSYNSNKRSTLHFVEAGQRRLGFGLDASTATATTNSFGYDGNFKNGDDTYIKYVGTPVEIAKATVRKNTSDTGAANVRIVFNYNTNCVTLFELNTKDVWTAVAQYDFDSKVGQELGSMLVFSVHSYDATSSIAIKNIKLVKGAYADTCVHVDTDKDHACDACGGQVGTHEAESGKHTCAYCGKAATQCADTDFDHLCNVCNAVLSDCEDIAPKNHECDYCGEAYKADEHVDTDHDHECDYGCKEPFGDHADGDDADHLCDYGCGAVADDSCHDAEKDHVCDECGGTVGEHADSHNDLDHVCDYCLSDEVLEECYDSATDGNHNCDACGEIAITDCNDADDDNKCDDCGADFDHLCEDVATKDHLCDICEKPMGTKCSDIEGDGNHKCDHCGTKINNCVDNDKDHVCDECGMINMGEHADGDDRDHDCDYCDRTVGEKCEDPNGDNICNECGHAMPGSITDRQNVSTRPNGMHNKAPVHEHTYVDGWMCACGKKNPDHVHAFFDSKCICGEDYVPTPFTWTLTTELKDGDLVLIGNPQYKKLLSTKKTGNYNVGVNYSETDFSKATNAEIFVVTVNDNGTYTFTSLTGKVLAIAASYTSLNETGQHKSWALTAKGETTFLVKNTGRNLYLEWYAKYNNWSSYSNASDSQFYISFYVKTYTEAHVHNYITDVHEPTCVEAGYTTYTCECRHTYTVDGDPATGVHSYTPKTTAPTCTEDGYITYTCSSCKDSYDEPGDKATGVHTYVKGKCACGAEDPDYVAPAVPEPESMVIHANKGTMGTKKITWTSDNFTLVNEQASSSTAIRTSDSDHFRVYASSKLTISATNGHKIAKVTIVATGSSYVTPAVNSFKTVAGVTVTSSGSIITVTVTDPAGLDEIIVKSATAQFRINAISVEFAA